MSFSLFDKRNVPTVILINYIHYDGIGDFSHLLDIIQDFLKYTVEMDIKLVPFVICLEKNKEFVIKKIAEIHAMIQVHVFDVKDQYVDIDLINQNFKNYLAANTQFKSDLKNALSIFQISTSLTKEHKKCLLQYCKPDIPVVNISEHCGLRTPSAFRPLHLLDDADNLPSGNLYNINDRWMGIKESPHRYGIKLREVQTKREQAILNLENKQFLCALLVKDHVSEITDSDVAAFLAQNDFIPGYLQDENSIFQFVKLCIEHQSIASGKTLIFYFNNYASLFTPSKKYRGENDEYLSKFEFMLWMHPKLMDQIELIEINQNGSINKSSFNNDEKKPRRRVRILTDFTLNDADYDRLFSIANRIAGCSGDNTLEKVLSHHLVPFFQLWQKYSFELDIIHLGVLASRYLSHIENLDTKSFEVYFSKNMRLDSQDKWDAILAADLTVIFKNWDAVINQLKKERNIYNHFKKIFYEAILHMSAVEGNVALLYKIHKLCPEIDLNIPNKRGLTIKAIAENNHHDFYLRAVTDLQAKSQSYPAPYKFR